MQPCFTLPLCKVMANQKEKYGEGIDEQDRCMQRMHPSVSMWEVSLVQREVVGGHGAGVFHCLLSSQCLSFTDCYLLMARMLKRLWFGIDVVNWPFSLSILQHTEI